MPVNDLEVVYRDPAALIGYDKNARLHSDEQVDEIATSIERFGFTNPILLKDDHTTIGAGHGRQMAALRLGLERVPTITLSGLSDAEWRAYVIADNRLAEKATWDLDMLRGEVADLYRLDMELPSIAGFSEVDLRDIGVLPSIEELVRPNTGVSGSLAARFGIAPFSVLNAREGWWQDRKSAWLAIGIQSEVGRGENLLKFSKATQLPARKV